MKKLEILIPQWKETDEVIKPLLDSIAIQQGVNLKRDVGVIIVNDGTDVYLSDELLNSYDFDIKYIKAESRGIAMTRDRAFLESTAEYIMFCDDDDMFFSALGIYTIFEYIDKFDEMTGLRGFDILVTKFKEELANPLGKPVYLNSMKGDSTFVHGKVYNRKFLADNNIRFNGKVPLHEDVYFNCIALAVANNIKIVDNCFYIWKNNRNSVTRSAKNFILDNIETLVICYDEITKELMSRGFIKNARINLTNTLYRMYFEYNTLKFQQNPDRAKVMMDMTKDVYQRNKKLYETTTDEEKIELLKNIGCSFAEKGNIFPVITFNEWFKMLED